MKLFDADALWERITNFEPMEMTFTINDADLDKLSDVIKDINVRECPYFDIADKYGNEARYYRENGWIPCTERLPEVGAILISDGNKIMVGEYYGDDTWGVDGCDYDPILEEIAWMPLPEPYKKEGGEE